MEMVTRFFYTCLLAIIFLSCSDTAKINEEKNSSKIGGFNLMILNNQELKNQIKSYYNTVAFVDPKYRIIGVFYESIDGNKVYRLRYMLNSTSMYYYPIHWLFEVDGHLTGFTILGLDDFQMSKKSVIEIMKKKFPDDYNYYQNMQSMKHGSPGTRSELIEEDDLPPPATGGYEVWKLTFKDGVLQKKEIGEW